MSHCVGYYFCCRLYGDGSGNGCCGASGKMVELLWDFGRLWWFREIDAGELVLCLVMIVFDNASFSESAIQSIVCMNSVQIV